MSLSFLATPIASGFIKGLMAIWLKDSEILKLGGTVGFEYFTKKTNDFYEARKTQRFFEELADHVLEDLSKYIQVEHKNLRKGDINAACKIILNLISSEGFNNIFIEERGDRSQITIKAISTLKKDIQAELIPETIVVSIAKHIIGKFLTILESLPEYNRLMLRSLLNDTTSILETVNRIELALVDNKQEIEREENQNEINYKKLFVRKFKNIELFGIDARNIKKKYNLELAYISLKLVCDEETVSSDIESYIINNQLEKYTVISGSAGSGKTTLLSWLANRVASRSVHRSFLNYSELLPVFVKVRELNTQQLPSAKQLIEDQLGVAGGVIDDRWILQQIRNGKFLFLIDGFDEVVEEKRQNIFDWIKEIGDAFPTSRFFITTRPYAATELKSGFLNYEEQISLLDIEPMSITQIEDFVEHWYDAYCQDTRNSDEFDRLNAAKERLLESYTSSTSLRAISNNPLLCALICFVNADRDGFVPSARGELYNIAVETLLERREAERGIKIDEHFSLTKAQKFKLIAYIAAYFFGRQANQLAFGDVSNYIKDFLPGLGASSEQSDEILSFFIQRSQILRSPAEGIIDFSHKTFQEYFYARRIIDAYLIEVTYEAFYDDDLTEVVLFVFSQAPSNFTDEVVKHVLIDLEADRGEGPSDIRREIILLHHCINEAAEIEINARRKIVNMLKKVLPPKTQEEADDLSSAGVNIIEPMLIYADKKYKKYWKNCVSALINTFDERAFPVLSVFAKLQSEVIDNELIKAQRYFENRDFNAIVLRNCQTIKQLTVNDVYDIDLLTSIESIQDVSFKYFEENFVPNKVKENVLTLKLQGCRCFSDLSLLKMFPNLEILEIVDNYGLDDFEEIRSCKHLIKLIIADELFYSTTCLIGLNKLKTLDLGDCVNLLDVESINKLSSISNITLPSTSLYEQIDTRLRKEVDDFEEDSDEFLEARPPEEITDLL